jgi:hypothetical protein
MISKGIIPLVLIMTYPLLINGQDKADSISSNQESYHFINGFVRAGFYGDLKDNPGNPFVSSAYSDVALKIGTGYTGRYRFYGDLRFRYGSEFTEPVKDLTVREAFGEVNFGQFIFSAGQKIIKWGRGDFTNPTSKLNPKNFISRSPDREDMDMGNIIASLSWHPSAIFEIEAAAVPFYKSSVLIIDPIPLPENVTVNQINSLVTGEELYSYGAKADLHMKGIDLGTSWFDGYDPMPGTALTSFTLDMSGPIPVTSTVLDMKPYRTRMAGLDFESSIGPVGLRGEAAWTKPVLSYQTSEYVPLEEIKWVAGADYSIGNWRFTGEYSGKTLLSFTPAQADPIFGIEPDLQKLAAMLSIPGFDLNEYVRNQVAAFNRLYNYQLEKNYHSGGIRIEADLAYGRLLPSVFGMYNFTTGDLLLIPELRIKPADGLTITAGAELYYGKKGSLFDIVDNFMTSIYIGIKADF